MQSEKLLGCIYVLLVVVCYYVSVAMAGDAQILHKWNSIQYMWPNDTVKNQYISTGKYIKDNNIITGIKVYKNQVYVTVPRWRLGIPSTLNVVKMTGSGKSVLQPFPSWEMQEIGNCESLQYVQSMEIDPNTGYMWIIDVGRINILDEAQNLCPAKLIIYDLNAEKVVMKYIFPENVVSKSSNFMNDIVLDYVNGEAAFAYISDTRDAKMHVFNYKQNTSYSFQHSSMNSDSAGAKITIGNDVLQSQTPIDGIAISPDFKHVYYCPLGGYNLYRVPTKVLREKGDFSSAVVKVGSKISQTDGMVFGQNFLYYGAFSQNAVYKWNQSEGTITSSNQIKLISDNEHMQWVDTLSFDENGNLWFVSNTLQRFFLGTMNSSDDYINIWKVDTNDKSYLWTANTRTRIKTGSGNGNNDNNNNGVNNGITYTSIIYFYCITTLLSLWFVK